MRVKGHSSKSADPSPHPLYLGPGDQGHADFTAKLTRELAGPTQCAQTAKRPLPHHEASTSSCPDPRFAERTFTQSDPLSAGKSSLPVR